MAGSGARGRIVPFSAHRLLPFVERTRFPGGGAEDVTRDSYERVPVEVALPCA